MLNPLVLVYALTLIASVFADYATDVRINKTYVAFMDRFETFLTKTGDQVVLQTYQSQLNSNASHSSNKSLSLDELRQYSNSVIDPLMDQYGPIAYQIIYNAGYNTKGNYYVFDNSTKQWHLPNQTAPANPVDGASLNAKHLGQELEKAFSQLLSNDQKQSVLQKRWMLRGVTAEAQSFVRNLHSLPADDALAHAIKFKETVTTSSPADQKALNEFINVVDNQLQLRKTGTTETNNFLKDIEINPNFYERKIKLSEKLKELEGNKAPEADQNVIRREISRLDEIIAAENRALFKSKIRNTIASFFM